MSSAGQRLVAGRVPGERIQTAIETTDSGTFTTGDTQVASITAALVSGRIYRVRFAGSFVSTVAADTVLARIREDTSGGTVLQEKNRVVGTTSGAGEALDFEVEFTAASSANKTFVVTAIRNGGTGTLHRDAAATRPSYLYVDYIRG